VIKVAIAGIGGRMGSSVYACLPEQQSSMLLSVATSAPGDTVIGRRVSEVLGGVSEVVISEQLSDDFDVLIDFTSVPSTLAHVEYCRVHGKAMVIGTTGFTNAQLEKIEQYRSQMKILMSGNMSLGINLMEKLAAMAAKCLQGLADIEVVETHHRHKVDAPSGTALMIGSAVAEAMGVALSDRATYTRQGLTGERESGTIGFSSIRGGDVVGEHSAYFYMVGECIEISHCATDRKIFARGALFAADFICQQPNGLYNMHDALQLNV